MKRRSEGKLLYCLYEVQPDKLEYFQGDFITPHIPIQCNAVHARHNQSALYHRSPANGLKGNRMAEYTCSVALIATRGVNDSSIDAC